MADIEKRKGSPKPGENLPAHRFTEDVEIYMDHIDYDDETEEYEAIATMRSMRRSMNLADYGQERAGNDKVKLAIAGAYTQAFTENSLARQRRRMNEGW